MSKRKAEIQVTPMSVIGRTSDKKFKPGIKLTYNPKDKTVGLRIDDRNNLPFWLETTIKIDEEEEAEAEKVKPPKEEGEVEEEEGEEESVELGEWIMYQGKLTLVTEENADAIMKDFSCDC
jgi:hypothetical protein